MVKEFRAFISRGNLVEVAVGLVMALAFKAVIDALVSGLLMPLIAAVFGKPNFDALKFTIGEGVFLYGTFLTQLVTFMLIGLALFLFVVKPYNTLHKRFEDDDVADPAPPPEDIRLLREIRDALQRS